MTINTEIREVRGSHEGVEYIMKIVRPYNFWSLSVPFGATPTEFEGLFTSTETAMEAVKNYANRMKNNKKSIHYVDPDPGAVKIKVAGKGKGHVVLEDSPKEE